MHYISKLLFILLCSQAIFANEVVTLSTGEWAPYTSEKDPKGRIAQIIVTEAFHLENIDVQYNYYNWKKVLKVASELQVEATMPWYETPKRKEKFLYSKQAIIRSRIVFFHLKSLDFKWNNFEDLKSYTIGATVGYKSTKLFESKNLNTFLTQTEQENYTQMANTRVDITASSVLVGYDIINKTFPKERVSLFTHNEKNIFPETGAHLLISKKHPRGKELMKKFDDGLKKLIKSGRYGQIIKNFMTNR